jgi:hypothetical protein
MKKITFVAVLLLSLLATVGVCAQGARKTSMKRNAAPRITVEGILYFIGSGSHIVECVLKTEQGLVNFSVAGNTQMKGFNPQSGSDPGWDLGARWRVGYRNAGRQAGLLAESVVYLGKTESIDNAQKIAYDYLNLLADAKFSEAYALLGGEATQNFSLNAFTKMYKEISVNMRGRIICSHTKDSVELLLAPHGSDGGDLFQPAEISRINDKWLINRLDAFKETAGGCFK